ncbi:hypothetical protein DMENIID0001_149120 [Sergentomyia squamirostris]
MTAKGMNVLWSNHLDKFSSAFPEMLSGGKFVDVTLACERRRIHCHRVILAASSPYFSDLLEENPERHPIMILPRDVKFCTLEALVNFMYKGQVTLNEDHVEEFLKYGEMLQIAGITRTSSADNDNEEEPCLETVPEENSIVIEDDDSGNEDSQMPELPLEVLLQSSSSINDLEEFPIAGSSSQQYPGVLKDAYVLLNDCQLPSVSTDPETTVNKVPKRKDRYKAIRMNHNNAVLQNSRMKCKYETALKAVRRGMSVSEAARQFKVSYGALYYYVKRNESAAQETTEETPQENDENQEAAANKRSTQQPQRKYRQSSFVKFRKQYEGAMRAIKRGMPKIQAARIFNVNYANLNYHMGTLKSSKETSPSVKEEAAEGSSADEEELERVCATVPLKYAPKPRDLLPKNPFGPPPDYFVFTKKYTRSFSREDLWAAMMEVKNGMSTKDSSQKYDIKYQTINDYMKKYGIKRGSKTQQ